MYPGDPREEHTARYEAGYQPGNYQNPRYQEPYPPHQPPPGKYPYPQQGYQDYGQQPGYGYPNQEYEPRGRPGPHLNAGMFVGGVLAAGLVSGLAAWLCAWIINLIANRVTQSGKLGIWNPMAEDAYWFGVVAFICAVLAGGLWFLLYLGTPSPETFFSWIIGILTIAAMIIPLTLSNDLWVGIATAIEHMVIGLPILGMVRMVGLRSIEFR